MKDSTVDSDSRVSKAYVRRTRDPDGVEIRVRYVDQELGMDRWFCFNKPLDDPIHKILERMSTSIDRASRRFRKKKSKSTKLKGCLERNEMMVTLNQNDRPIDPTLAGQKLLELENVVMTINGSVFQLTVNPPMVLSVRLPSPAMAGFSIYPAKLELHNCGPLQCEFKWSKCRPASSTSATPSEDWISLGSGMLYAVTTDHIGSWLRLECSPTSDEGLAGCAVTLQPVEAGPGLCPFEKRHQFTQHRMDETGYSYYKALVVCYKQFVTS